MEEDKDKVPSMTWRIVEPINKFMLDKNGEGIRD